MARSRYEITESDALFARDYLLNALNKPDYEIKDPGAFEFRRYLEKFQTDDDHDISQDAGILNRWCETCLSTEQWQKLKTTIRKRRYQSQNKDITITLTPQAYSVLVSVKESGQAKTLSDAIIWLNNNATEYG